MTKVKAAVIGVIVLVVLAVAGGSLYTVREDQYGVVTKFGKIVAVNENAGLHFKLPFVEQVRYVPSTTQIYDIAPSDVITKDKKSMIADDFILWKVADAKKFSQTLNASVTSAQDRVSVAAYNATKSIISSMSQDEVIEARGERLTSLITEESNSDLGSYGIEIRKAELSSRMLSLKGNADTEREKLTGLEEELRRATAEADAKREKIKGIEEKVDELTAKLQAAGYKVISGPRTTGDGYYESCVVAVEGNQIEITE